MSKCSTCRKNDAMDTWLDKARYFLMHFLFPMQVVDLSQDRFTQGFSDGYKVGCRHTLENVRNEGKIYE